MKDRCPGFRRSLAAFLAGVGGCSASTALAAPAPLSDAALDRVTAGTTERAPAESGKPPAVVVADGARYVFHGSQSVRLEADAQSGLRALNVTGAAGSDVGNALNVLATGAYGESAVSQRNTLDQSEHTRGALGAATLGGTNMTRSTRSESRFADGSSTSAVTGQRLHAATRTSDTHTSAMSVPEFNPLKDIELSFELPTLPSITIDPIVIDLLNDARTFGMEATVGPFTIVAPQLDLGVARFEGPDIVFASGSVTLPEFDLGEASVTACFAACGTRTVRLGKFLGQTVNFPDLRLDGANPFKDTSINAGFGLALVGTGAAVARPSHLHISGELSVDLPGPSFTFKFLEIPSILEIDGEDIIGPWPLVDGPTIGIDIPPITLSFTLIDEDIGFEYSANFDGVLCLAVGTTDCGSASQQIERQATFVDVAIDTARSSSYSEQGGSISEEIATHAGASLRDAEADLVAMSSASAEIVTDNTVSLDDSAQRGLQAVNAVNAADAIVGNAVNVTVLQPSRWAPGSAIGALNQSNVFSQYRTQYGL